MQKMSETKYSSLFFMCLFFLFLIFIFVSQVVLAEEQTVEVTANVSDSFVGRVINWFYSAGTKQFVVGSTFTLATLLTGIGLYYLFKIL